MHNGISAEDMVVGTPSRTIFALPFWIAEKKGFFRDEEIAPRLEIISDNTELKSKLVSGQIKFSIDTPGGILLDVIAGGSTRIIAGSARKPPLFLVTRPEIRALEQLRGATFGVLSTREGSSKLIPIIARSVGIGPNEYRIESVGGAPKRMQLLEEGKIDAALQPLPLNYEGEAKGFNSLVWAGAYEPEWQFTTVNTNLEWAGREPEKVTAMLRALLRGQKFMLSDPDEAADIAAVELRTDAAYVRRALSDSARLGILDPDLNWSNEAVERIYRDLESDGSITAGGRFEIGKFVSPEFLRSAQSSKN